MEGKKAIFTVVLILYAVAFLFAQSDNRLLPRLEVESVVSSKIEILNCGWTDDVSRVMVCYYRNKGTEKIDRTHYKR